MQGIKNGMYAVNSNSTEEGWHVEGNGRGYFIDEGGSAGARCRTQRQLHKRVGVGAPRTVAGDVQGLPALFPDVYSQDRRVVDLVGRGRCSDREFVYPGACCRSRRRQT